ncbi:hypothetical protein HDU86_000989 [Geranomyces michiganensis]|nr:hypothetical protein HDU86_000989 [Geranomyces michiganensis]
MPSISTFFHAQIPSLRHAFLSAEAECFMNPRNEELMTAWQGTAKALAVAKELAASRAPPAGCTVALTVTRQDVGVVASWELVF